MTTDWVKKDIWKREGKDFSIEVSRHTTRYHDESSDEGVNRWCVYAYIYPTHPHFKKFEGDRMWQDAATALPLHCGVSFLRYHRDDDGKVTSVQVGADYHHLYDNAFTFFETKEDAYRVFSDAGELYAWLDGCWKTEESQNIRI